MSDPTDDEVQRKQSTRDQDCSADHDDNQLVYSSFSHRQKMMLACAASTSAMFSGLSSFIYYPAITALARDLHVPITSINLTITSYLVVAGLAPSVLGDLADRIGRRPVSLIALTTLFLCKYRLRYSGSLRGATGSQMCSKCWCFEHDSHSVRDNIRHIYTGRAGIVHGHLDGFYKRCALRRTCPWRSSCRETFLVLDLLALVDSLWDSIVAAPGFPPRNIP